MDVDTPSKGCAYPSQEPSAVITYIYVYLCTLTEKKYGLVESVLEKKKKDMRSLRKHT